MGGNVSIKGHNAQQLDLKVTNREQIVPILHSLLISINIAFTKTFNTPLWSAALLKNQTFLSGSSLHFFNTKGIPTQTFTAKKPTVGDMDTMVDKTKEQKLSQFLTDNDDKMIGPAKLLGFKAGTEQYISLWELQTPPIKIQIDFEFVDYKNGAPTEWARFSHSSAWEDMQNGVKGVFHKWLIQAFTRLSTQEFYLRKKVGRGKARLEQDVKTRDNMYSFAVTSKEGGGLRAKYEPVIDPKTNRPMVKDNLRVMTAAPTEGYEQNIGKIFSTILGKRISPKDAKVLEKNFWSFTGLVSIMNSVLSTEDKSLVVDGFLEKLFGSGAQGMYKNDPERDIEEKSKAVKYLIKHLGVKPKNLTKMIKAYHSSYKMTDDGEESASIVKSMAKSALKETAPSYKRKGIPHIYNPGSTVEMKDAEFIQMCNEIEKMGGTVPGASINLKVDGAGIRFGKDETGKPFFMTSSVNTPKYAEDYGDFQKFVSSKTQDPERIAFAKKYDEALKIVLGSEFVQKLPNDTIVQAEMLFSAMGQQGPDGVTFVNIPYDPKKLGSVMTIVPYAINQYSTGNPSEHADAIKKLLLQNSNDKIKIVNNQLADKGPDVSSIIGPIVKNADKLLAAIKSRGPGAEKAKEILSQARKQLSEQIYNSPEIIGKDQLGNTIEGLVINMPSGITAKVTSGAMQEKVAAKQAEKKKPTNNSKRNKPAVVTIGSFVGHKGHQQLIDQTIATAQKVGGVPYVYVSPVVGVDDPIPPKIKLATLRKLYPSIAKNIQVWHDEGTPMKKIEKELVLPENSPYNKIILIVGSDRYEGFKNWMDALEKRMKDPQAVKKFGGTQNQVDFETIRSERGTGISFTNLRNTLKDANLDEKAKQNQWLNAFDSDKLGKQWIMKLMQLTNAKLQKTLKEQIKSQLSEASFEQKKKLVGILSTAIKQLEK